MKIISNIYIYIYNLISIIKSQTYESYIFKFTNSSSDQSNDN